MLILVVVGFVTAALGTIVAILSGNALSSRTRVEEFQIAMGGYSSQENAIAQAQLGIGIGIAMLAVGVVLLVAALIINAARRPSVSA